MKVSKKVFIFVIAIFGLMASTVVFSRTVKADDIVSELHSQSGDYLYTDNTNESSTLQLYGGWELDYDNTMIMPDYGTTSNPVYRLFNPTTNKHFFTADINEESALANSGWRYEGIGFYSNSSGATPVYRVYNGITHYWSENYSQISNMITYAGYHSEGIAWYAK